MKPKSSLNKQQLLWLGILVLVLLGLMTPSLVLALPPRTTPNSTNSADKEGKDQDKNRPVGAYIQLQAATLPGGSWAAVQWQDNAGNWHDVEGWQGALPASTHWWVSPRDFGKGPFRWAVTQGPGGALLGLSSPFHLPNGVNETVGVTAVQAP